MKGQTEKDINWIVAKQQQQQNVTRKWNDLSSVVNDRGETKDQMSFY